MYSTAIFGVMLLLAATATANISVNIVMSARGLPNLDIFDGAPDPYVKVMKAEGTSENYGIVGTTSTIDNQNNPDWPEVFNFNYIVGANQRLRFELWDYDYDADDYIGKVDVTLEAIVGVSGSLEIQISDCQASSCGFLRINKQLNGEITINMDRRFINPKTVIVAQ